MAKAITTTTVRNFLSLSGTGIPLKAVSGGGISAEIVKEYTGADRTIDKRLGATIYEDFIVETEQNDEIIKSIKKTWDGENLRLNGSFITADVNYRVRFEDEFMDALLAETTIPQCDASSKETAVFRLRIKPSLIQNRKGDGRVIGALGGQRQKQMLASNFKFKLGSLPCSRVAVVESFSVKLNIDFGSQEENGKDMTIKSVDFPNLFLIISSVDIDPWFEWHKQFVVDRKDNADELSGSLVFLAPDLRAELFVINLLNVGIFSLHRQVESTNTVSRFRVGLYCEKMEIES